MFIDQIYVFLDRWGNALLTLVLITFFCLVVIKSGTKLLWLDEFFTATVAMQPDWRHFIGAMPPEGNPPLNALITRMFFHLLGVSVFSLRLTAMISFTGALAFLYVFVRRELGKIFGLLAVMLMLAEPSANYAFEARPYGLMLLFFMIALTGWQAAAHAAELPLKQSRALALSVMGIGIAGTILAHNIGVVEIAVPLILGEGVRTLQRRKFDWPVLTTGLAAVPALLIVRPIVHHTKQVVLVHAANITRPITLHKLIAYTHFMKSTTDLIVSRRFSEGLLLLVLLCGASRLRFVSRVLPPSREATKPQFRIYIMAAAVGALVLVPVTWLAMIPAGGWYFCRYGIGSVIGIALVACLVVSISRMSRFVVICLLGISCCSFVRVYRAKAYYAFDQAGLKLISTDKSDLPIVISDPMDYPTMWWYAPQEVKERLVYLPGAPTSPLVVAGLMAEKPYTQAKLEEFDTFAKSNNRALLRCKRSQAAFLDKWRSAGFETNPIQGEDGMYEVVRTSRPQTPSVVQPPG